MAKTNFKVIGIVATLIGLTITVVTIAYSSGGKVATVGEQIVSVKENAVEDRKAIESVAERTTALEDEVSEAKLRDERIAGQFTEITSYMRTESKKTDEMHSTIKDVQKAQTEQTVINAVNSEKLQTLIKGK